MAVKVKDTKPEIVIREFLFLKGLRYLENNRKLSGSPDIVLKKYKTIIFIDGWFWHGHEGYKYWDLYKTFHPLNFHLYNFKWENIYKQRMSLVNCFNAIHGNVPKSV